MNNKKIIIIYQETGKTPELKKIQNDITTFEKLLNGKIQIIPYDDILIICKKDRQNLIPNIYIRTKCLSIGETIRGNIIITSKKFENFSTLTKEQIIKSIHFLEYASFHFTDTY